jgi:hypothetical protein
VKNSVVLHVGRLRQQYRVKRILGEGEHTVCIPPGNDTQYNEIRPAVLGEVKIHFVVCNVVR